MALLGLPVVNLGLTFGEDRFPVPDAVSAFVYHDLVYQRFFTIFCFLFGVSFALILYSASSRTKRPRLVLARGLVLLFTIGMVQLFVLDGNLQLAVYAVLGMLMLLPLSNLSRRAELIVGVALLVASLPITELDPENAGYPVKVLLEWSGLLVLGTSVVRYGIHTELRQRGRQIGAVFLGTAVVAIAVMPLWPGTADVFGAILSELKLLATSTAYVTGVLLLVRTRVGPRLIGGLAPVGRMALICFLTQAVAAMTFAAAVDVRDWSYAVVAFGCTTAFVALQAVVCSLWLRRYRYGPVEWVWRCVTWLSVVPIRRTPVVMADACHG